MDGWKKRNPTYYGDFGEGADDLREEFTVDVREVFERGSDELLLSLGESVLRSPLQHATEGTQANNGFRSQGMYNYIY